MMIVYRFVGNSLAHGAVADFRGSLQVDIEGGVEIVLHVRPNIALEQKILKHGEMIQVFELTSLVESIRQRISYLLDRYLYDML